MRIQEAHGTGTRTGDPIEAGAIGKVFGRGRPSNDPLWIGSVKSNIGHLEAASGLASIIKTAMILEKGLIPPSINYENPNPDIDFEALKLRVSTVIEIRACSALSDWFSRCRHSLKSGQQID